MSPDYPKSGSFYTFDDETGKYEAAEPPKNIDFSTVPRMNRAARRRQERAWAKAYPPKAARV